MFIVTKLGFAHGPNLFVGEDAVAPNLPTPRLKIRHLNFQGLPLVHGAMVGLGLLRVNFPKHFEFGT